VDKGEGQRQKEKRALAAWQGLNVLFFATLRKQNSTPTKKHEKHASCQVAAALDYLTMKDL